MPHQCTNCGHTFPDGSKEMLSGCPDCGGNKFQFKPEGASSNTDTQPTANTSAADGSATETPAADASTGESVTIDPSPEETPSADRQTSPPETEGFDTDAEVVTDDATASAEAPAQSTARSDVVSSSELTAAGSLGPDAEADDGETPDSAPDSTPDSGDRAEPTGLSESNLDELRKELNNQFESIRIVNPGQYELNLMELYDRDEYIISLREDGRYVIEVPDGWGDS